MKRSHVIAGLLAIVALLFASAAIARGPGRMGERMLKDLGLSAAQLEQVSTLKQQMKTATKPLHDDLKALHEQMLELWKVDAPDRAAILRLHAEIDAVRAKLQVAHIDHRLAVHAILTPEQRAKAAERMDRKGFGRGGRGVGAGPGGAGGFGPGFGNPDCPFAPGGADAQE